MFLKFKILNVSCLSYEVAKYQIPARALDKGSVSTKHHFGINEAKLILRDWFR